MSDQPNKPDEPGVFDRVDALLSRHRTHPLAGDGDADIPVLTEVVVEQDDDIPILQDLAPEYTAAAAFPEVDQDADIPVLEEALPDSLADVTAFAVPHADPLAGLLGEAADEVVLEFDSPAERSPVVELVDVTSGAIEIHVDEPVDDIPVLLEVVQEASPAIMVPDAPASVAEALSSIELAAIEAPAVSDEAAVGQRSVSHDVMGLTPLDVSLPVGDEDAGGELFTAAVPMSAASLEAEAQSLAAAIWLDVEDTLEARVEALVRQRFAIKLAALYKETLGDALRVVMADIKQDLRGTIEQIVAEQLAQRERL